MKPFKYCLYIFFISYSCITQGYAQTESIQFPKKYLNYIYLILQYNTEHYMHNIGHDNMPNIVVLSDNGHQEKVYTKEGILVTHPTNKGSYNFASPSAEPLRHFLVDVNPWLLHGNDPNDTSTLEQRINAYANDLNNSIKTLLTQKNNPHVYPTKYTEEQLVTLEFFIDIFDVKGKNQTLSLFSQHEIYDEEFESAKAEYKKALFLFYSDLKQP